MRGFPTSTSFQICLQPLSTTQNIVNTSKWCHSPSNFLMGAEWWNWCLHVPNESISHLNIANFSVFNWYVSLQCFLKIFVFKHVTSELSRVWISLINLIWCRPVINGKSSCIRIQKVSLVEYLWQLSLPVAAGLCLDFFNTFTVYRKSRPSSLSPYAIYVHVRRKRHFLRRGIGRVLQLWSHGVGDTFDCCRIPS